MDLAVLGWPADGPTLRLDHERFPYAGKFVTSDTGKAVGREDGAVVAASSFSPDRTDGDVLRIRYITVRVDARGAGRGPTLADFVAERAFERGFSSVKIAVNNPFAYEAMYRAGFAFTGAETGLAELVLERPRVQPDAAGSTDGERRAVYLDGLERFAERDLEDAARTFVSERLDGEPPDPDRPRHGP